VESERSEVVTDPEAIYTRELAVKFLARGLEEEGREDAQGIEAVMMRYGIGCKAMSVREIAKAWGIRSERARYMLDRGVLRLRRNFNARQSARLMGL